MTATRGEQMLALRRARMAAAPPILRGGFRPFFLGGSAWAVLALALWLVALAGGGALPSAFDPLAWHRHEMLFGFVGAVIAGFLLTAIPNWTGRLPIAGPPLAALFGLWLAGRVAVLFSTELGRAPAAALDVGFYLILAGLAAREVLAAKNRNLPIVGLVLLLGLANAADHAAAAGLFAMTDGGVFAAMALVILMISLIGGRIIPSFTRNWMQKQGLGGRLPAQPGRFDLAVIAATAAALLGWILLGESRLVGALLVGAGLLQALWRARWRGLRAARDPLGLIRPIGDSWLP
ncbi:MAG: NnrS family protein, partial [Sphingosinicella sp.]|uniref:NnrS family protein n=1 Tax=Sphingosinicella sp. TaxID=1917971 RepID=UPI0040377DA5